jgi:dienelactone hydrolase
LGVAIALCATAGVTAQDGPPDPEAMRRMMDERNRLPNTPGDGPYSATLGADAGLPGHVVYRPADLTPFGGGRMPIVIWGNGGCADDGTAHRFHLAQIASYGYLVVAAGHWRSGPGAADGPAPLRSAPEGQLPPPATTAADVLAGLDWAIAEHGRLQSPLYGKVDTTKVAVAGHSCGGLQAIELAADPRIDTVLIHNSGIFNDENSPIQSMRVSKSQLDNFHQPVIYILGGATDIAFANGEDDYTRVSKVPIMKANLPVGHGGTFGQPMGGAVAHVAVDWLDWQLRGDEVAGRTFAGDNCRLCSGTDWSLERKGW